MKIKEKDGYSKSSIGEAAKNISRETREKYKEVEWSRIIGTKDKMIHHYFGVNLDIVWDIIKKDLPDLKQKLLKIKEDLEEQEKQNKTSNEKPKSGKKK